MLLVGFTVLILSLSEIESASRHRRRLDEFGEMIHHTTGRGSLDYNEYGNYCGLGGSGSPVDSIDRCCQIHDACYHDVNRDQCAATIKLKPYVEKYKWEVENGNIICLSPYLICKQATCMCDKAAAECFGLHKEEYDRNQLRNVGKLLSDLQHLFGG